MAGLTDEVLSRLTRAQLVAKGYALIAALEDRDREVDVLTAERDALLLRIEGLERILEDVDPNDRLYRGGVNPNA